MHTFLAFMIAYAAGGFWLFTHPAVCGVFCLSPDIAVVFWFLIFMMISLFILFVFPAAPPDEVNAAVSRYLVVGLMIFFVYVAFSFLAFWFSRPA